MTDYIYSIEAKNVNKNFIKRKREFNALKDFNITIKPLPVTQTEAKLEGWFD